jgi:cysteine synthase A
MQNILESVGNTPLIQIEEGIFAKLETYNPTGSIKDRIAAYILTDALKNGFIKKGDTVIEATSGNTGIAMSWACSLLGLKMKVVMPSNMSQQRKMMIKYFGAELIEVGPSDFEGACILRDKMVKEKGFFTPSQFDNPLNEECHYLTTGVEILNQIPKNLVLDAFVAGVGTGGTFSGTGKKLRENFPKIALVPVEPLESAVLSGAKLEDLKPHGIQGIGDGFIPKLMDTSIITEIGLVCTKDAVESAKELAKKGVLCGISSGANYFVAKNLKQKGYKNIVTIICDRAERYVDDLFV